MNIKKPWKIIELPNYSSPAKPGALVVAEVEAASAGKFDCARRVYFSVNRTDAPEVRGGHRYPKGGKQIFIIVATGRVTFDLHYPNHCERVVVDRSDRALVIDHDVWLRTILDPDTLILTVASTEYLVGEGLTDSLCGCDIS